MASGDSVISICNLALAPLGEDPITTLQDTVKGAVWCGILYDPVRRALLRRGPWNFAKTRAAIPASSTTPPFGYDFAYPLPPDCLKVVSLPDAEPGEKWEVESGQILTNLDGPLNIIYTQDVTDPTRFDALFVATLAKDLGKELVRPLSKDTALRATMDGEVSASISAGRLASSQENSAQTYDDDVLLRSRA